MSVITAIVAANDEGERDLVSEPATPMLWTRDGHAAPLGGIYRGQSAFLVCSGPSLRGHDLSRLQQRGIVTLAVNNAATVVRPQLWVSVDDPGNFCDAIWRDPGIWKFVPQGHLEKQFTVRKSDGRLVPSSERVGEMPCVFGYRRNDTFVAEKFLYESTFNWGNHAERIGAYGQKGSRSVMYVALRLLFHLGFRRDVPILIGRAVTAPPVDVADQRIPQRQTAAQNPSGSSESTSVSARCGAESAAPMMSPGFVVDREVL